MDISAPNGTPVYAVAAGQVHLEDARAVSVAAGDVDFGYWHVVPVVRHREVVARHQLLGHIEAPWLHVHFAERRGGVSVLSDAKNCAWYDRLSLRQILDGQ